MASKTNLGAGISNELAHRRRRVSRPKTRTGCVTCKIRRVKCDEKKPECARCTKFGAKCDGYPSTDKKEKSLTRPSPLKIRPWLGPKQTLVISSRVPLNQPSSSMIFRNDTEKRYFDAFRKEVIPEISGIWDNSFWGSIVLSACDEPFILDAVLAIAAISLSIKETRKTPRTLEDGINGSRSSSKHYQFALERFGRAVRTMRSILTNDEQHLRKALIGCLLVFCFEGFQGYPKQALVHAISGYHLLQSWMIKKSYPLVLPNSTPPVTSLIEKELMDAFNRLHTNAVTVMGDSCSEEAYMLEHASGEQVVQSMPRTFADFSEAHRYFVHIMKRCAVFIQMAVGLPLDPTSSSNEQQSQEQSASTMYWGASIHVPFPKGPVSQHILEMHAKHVSELAQWQLSFSPLRLNTDPATQVGATVLQAGWTGICMIVNTAVARTECFWDQFLPEFRAIVSLAKTLFRILPRDPALAQRGGFSLDISIVPPLYIVCKYCRDGTLRREAIALIDLCPRREGVWDSGLVTKVSTFLMEVEEEGMVDGYIPEYARARIQKVAVNVMKKTADVECAKRIPGTEGEVSIRRKRIKWD